MMHGDIESGGQFITIDSVGVLRVKAGYAWDGPSGPTFDTRNFMRGSLVHDCLYQLMREGEVDQRFRKAADQLLRAMCIEDGMSRARASWVYWGVRTGGSSSAKRQPTPEPRHAP